MFRELTELFHDRQYLDEYATDLHKNIDPFGESVYMVFGRLALLKDAPSIDFKIESPTKISKDQYLSLLYVIDALEKALQNMEGRLSDNPWAYTSAKSSGQVFKSELIEATQGLLDGLEELGDIIDSINSEFEASIPNTWEGSKHAVDRITTFCRLPLFPPQWKEAERRSMLIVLRRITITL